MLGRFILLSLIPAWVWIGLLAVAALFGLATVLVVATDSSGSAASADFRYQCDSALGPDEQSTTDTSANTGTTETIQPSDIPTANPFAEITVAPDDSEVSGWERDCVTAMQSAPYQLPALRVTNGGAAVDCARQIALAEVGQSMAAATLVKNVIYQASAVWTTGRCGVLGAAPGDSVASAGRAGAEPAPAATGCGRSAQNPGTAVSSVVVLPDTIAAQGLCGQRVEADRISAGDLVFWEYRSHAPTRVGIAVGPAAMVTADPITGGVLETGMPSGDGVRVKRVLGSGS
ncbi:hypothetical protein [Nocardia mikamii]|uniref:hypothetical protein n=1 Tax=Nocardia mikamii TaxID=508464 RepID=UPI0007A4394D|nr:hypothetical protein [Nocardia mikamii]